MDISKLHQEKSQITIDVTLVGDSDIKKLNKKYRDKDYATDVLSFNLDQDLEDGKYHIGEIVVNIDQAKRQASEYENSLEEEIAELVEHGVLHLLGIHHEGDDH